MRLSVTVTERLYPCGAWNIGFRLGLSKRKCVRVRTSTKMQGVSYISSGFQKRSAPSEKEVFDFALLFSLFTMRCNRQNRKLRVLKFGGLIIKILTELLWKHDVECPFRRRAGIVQTGGLGFECTERSGGTKRLWSMEAHPKKPTERFREWTPKELGL